MVFDVFKATRNVIKYSILVNQENRKTIDSSIYSPKSFLKEYCTVKINVSRQVGQTTSLLDILEGESFIYVGNRDIQIDTAKQKVGRDFNSINLSSSENILDEIKYLNEQNPIDYIAIDEAFFASKKKLDELYDAVVELKIKPTFLLIG